MYTENTLQLGVSIDACACWCVSHISTHMKGLCLSILGPDLWLSDGCEVGPAHCQQSSTTVKQEASRYILSASICLQSHEDDCSEQSSSYDSLK